MQTNQALLERNLKALLWAHVTNVMSFINPILMLFYMEKGVTMSEFFYGLILVPLSLIAVEIPSGYLADKWQRKYVYLLGGLITLAGYIVLWFANGSIEMYIAFALSGVGFGFIRSSSGAILYDTLLALKRGNEHSKIFGGLKAYGRFYMAGAALIAGFLFDINSYIPLILQLILTIMFVVSILLLKEPPREKKERKAGHLQEMWQTFKFAMFKHEDICWIIFVGGAIQGAYIKAIWIIQPTIQNLGLPLIYVGFGAAGASIIIAGFSKYCHRLIGNYGTKSLMFVSAICPVIAYSGAACLDGIPSLVILTLACVGFGLSQVIVQILVNSRVSSEERATVLSLVHTFISLTYSFITFVFAELVAQYDMSTALLATGILIGFIALPSWWKINFNYKRINSDEACQN